MSGISILVADDDTEVREGITALLAEHGDLCVVGDAADGRATLRQLESLTPDILLLDVRMPGGNGLEILEEIGARSPRTRTLVHSAFPDEEYVTEAFFRGARGYLLKPATHEEIAEAIRRVHAGEVVAEPKVVGRVLEGLLRKVNPGLAGHPGLLQRLTSGEQAVLGWLHEGMTNTEIVQRLGTTEKALRAHLGNIFDKLHLQRRSEILRHLLRDRESP